MTLRGFMSTGGFACCPSGARSGGHYTTGYQPLDPRQRRNVNSSRTVSGTITFQGFSVSSHYIHYQFLFPLFGKAQTQAVGFFFGILE